MTTRFTELVGCDVPIQLGGMGPICSEELCPCDFIIAQGSKPADTSAAASGCCRCYPKCSIK